MIAGSEIKQLNVELPAWLHTQIKAAAAQCRTTVKDILVSAVEEYLRDRAGGAVETRKIPEEVIEWWYDPEPGLAAGLRDILTDELREKKVRSLRFPPQKSLNGYQT